MQEVNKIRFAGMNQDDPDIDLNGSMQYRRARNVIPGLGGFTLKNIPGTTLRENASLPAGTNKVIGTYTDNPNNRIIYFVYNSNGSHGIWSFNPKTKTHTKIIQSSALAFSLSNRIHSAGMIQNYLYWTDGANPVGYLDTSTPLTGTISYKRITLNRIRPILPPVGAFGTDAGAPNNLNADSWHFCTRFVYPDNSYSLLSPISKIKPGRAVPDSTNSTNSKITVTQTVDSDIKGDLKTVQFLVSKNGSGQFFLFDEVKATGVTSYSSVFRNTEYLEPISEFETEFINNVPRQSESLAVKENRVFAVNSTTGYEDEGNFTLTLSNYSGNTTQATLDGIDQPGLMHYGGTYKVGVLFYSEFGETNGIISPVSITIPDIVAPAGRTAQEGVNPYDFSGSHVPWVTWTVSGTPPSFAKYFSLCSTKNLTKASMFTTRALVLLYLRDLGDGTLSSDEFAFNDRVYTKNTSKMGAWNDFVTLKIPSNLAASIDPSWKVRLINVSGSSIETIRDIQGDTVILASNFHISNWNTNPRDVAVEFFKPTENADSNTFYEQGAVYSISGGNFSTTTGRLYGDCYGYNDFLRLSWQLQPDSGTLSTSYTGGVTPGSYGIFTGYWLSPTTASMLVDDQVQTKDTVLGVDASNNTPIGQQIKEKSTPVLRTSVIRVNAPDYNKICSNAGRSFPIIRNKQIVHDNSTLVFSDPYIPTTTINGTTRFAPENSYSLPLDRGPIVKLVPIPTSKVILALHERAATSLYLGEAFLSTPDGTEAVTKTDTVIGNDRLLNGGYGCGQFPFSVVEDGKGKCYWFDAVAGEALRYDSNGVVPIGSTYKMKSFFNTVGIAVENFTADQVIAGYDGLNQIYFLTFLGYDGNTTIGFLDRDGQERWIGFYDFAPEMYAGLGDRMYSFQNGHMYEHGVSSTYGNFLGTAYPCSVTPVFNPEFSFPKILRTLGIESNGDPWEVTSCTDPEGLQDTVLTESRFKKQDKIWYAPWLRNTLTNPALLKPGQLALLSGKLMVSKTFDITLSNDATEAVELEAINIGYQKAPGHGRAIRG